MKHTLRPTYQLAHYSEITAEWLRTNGIRLILSDLDGTLAPHNEMPDAAFEEWLAELERAECSLIVVSNNGTERIDAFVKQYKVVGIANCKKPSIRTIEDELIFQGLELKGALLLGDQLFTDVWCGKRLGIETAWVTPIPGTEPWKTSCKRGIEGFFRKKWNSL